MRWLVRILALFGAYVLARRLWKPVVEASTEAVEGIRSAISGDGDAVDHNRAPGVPPPSNDDYQELLDQELAGSFPASDPPSGW